jgi:hypothetical protein
MRAARLHLLRDAPAVAGLRRIVWDDLRDDLPRLDDVGPATRVLGRIGIVAIVAATAQLLLVDRLRAASTLVAGHADLGGPVQLVPLDLVPLTVAGFVIAWSFLLAGASKAHVAPALAVVGLFGAITLVWVSGSAPTASLAQKAIPLAATLVAIVAAVAGRWAAERAHVLMFAIVLGAVAVSYGGALVAAAPRLDAVAAETPVVTLALLLSLARGLALPFLVVVGFGTALFVYRVAAWMGDSASTASQPAVLPLSIAALATACLILAVRTLASGATAGTWAGALFFVLIPTVMGAAVMKLRGQTQHLSEGDVVATAEGSIPAIAAGLFAPMAVVTVVLLATSAAGAVVQLSGVGLGLPPGVDGAVNRAADAVTESLTVYRALFVVVAAVSGVVILPRRPSLGLYLVVLGSAHGWAALTAGTPLDWDGSSQVAAWLALGVVSSLALDVVARRVDHQRARGYVVALGVVLLYGQTGALDSPFHPVFAVTGVTLVVAAIGLDTLTSGSWANDDSRLLPRASRLPLYIGYALFTLTLVAWAAGTHDLSQFDLYTGEAAAGGLRLFGDPLLLTLVAVLVRATDRTRA